METIAQMGRDTELKPPADSLRKEPPMSENSTDRKTIAAEQPARGKDHEQPEAPVNGDLASLHRRFSTQPCKAANSLTYARLTATQRKPPRDSKM